MNHYPIFARKPARECVDSLLSNGGTVDPFAAVTCPACKARLQAKRDSEIANSEAATTADVRNFHAANARQWENTINGVHNLDYAAAA